RRQRLDRRERDHFAADLGEAPGAALDGEEALLVDGDDVAGVVPAFGRRFEHAGIFDLEIAGHHVRPPPLKPAPPPPPPPPPRPCCGRASVQGRSAPTVPNLLNIGVFKASAGAVSVTP